MVTGPWDGRLFWNDAYLGWLLIEFNLRQHNIILYVNYITVSGFHSIFWRSARLRRNGWQDIIKTAQVEAVKNSLRPIRTPVIRSTS